MATSKNRWIVLLAGALALATISGLGYVLAKKKVERVEIAEVVEIAGRSTRKSAKGRKDLLASRIQESMTMSVSTPAPPIDLLLIFNGNTGIGVSATRDVFKELKERNVTFEKRDRPAREVLDALLFQVDPDLRYDLDEDRFAVVIRRRRSP